MKLGVFLYGSATVAFGILDLVWGKFDRAHQPIQALVEQIPGRRLLVYVIALWMIAAGLAVLWRRSARIGAAASAILYSIFAVLWLPLFYSAAHTLGWRLNVLVGLLFFVGQELFLIAPAVLIYLMIAPHDLVWQKRAVTAARWMLGLPPIFFGLDHLINLQVFAGIVPHWLQFGAGWTILTGIAFIVAGFAICLGMRDLLAAKLLALMLLIFELLVEIPPIFTRLHSLETWGAAVYNLAAIGACGLFLEYFAQRSKTVRREEDLAGLYAIDDASSFLI